MEATTPQLNDSTKALRGLRYIILLVVVGALIGALQALLPEDIRNTRRASTGYLGLLAIGMTLVGMLLAYAGGFQPSKFTGKWKEQLLEIVAFCWSLLTIGAIARLLHSLIQVNSDNSGIMVVYALLLFIVGCLVFLPFQLMAARAYARRKGILMWPNIPKE